MPGEGHCKPVEEVAECCVCLARLQSGLWRSFHGQQDSSSGCLCFIVGGFFVEVGEVVALIIGSCGEGP
jgi:hypothetical protein